MKPVDKKDLPKLYVLVALAVCILGYFVYSMIAGDAPAASAAGTKTDTAKNGAPGTAVASNKGGAPAGGAAGASAQDTPPVAFDPGVYGPPQGGRDPFQPVGPTAPTTPTPAPVANNTPPSPKVPPLFPPSSGPKPERPRPPSRLADLLGPGSNAGATAVRPVEIESPPAPALVVTGVVLGDPTSGNPRNVAILRGNSSEERRFVSVGDYVGNGYTVVAVHADGVEIQDKAGNRRVTIKLGQPGDNARAK